MATKKKKKKKKAKKKAAEKRIKAKPKRVLAQRSYEDICMAMDDFHSEHDSMREEVEDMQRLLVDLDAAVRAVERATEARGDLDKLAEARADLADLFGREEAAIEDMDSRLGYSLTYEIEEILAGTDDPETELPD